MNVRHTASEVLLLHVGQVLSSFTLPNGLVIKFETNQILNRILLIDAVKVGGPKALHHLISAEKWALFNTSLR
jgi:hypothetical protein